MYHRFILIFAMIIPGIVHHTDRKGENMDKFKMDLQLFAEGEVAAAGAESTGTETAEPITTGSIQAGDTLPDGTKVGSPRVAAAMEKQMQRHPELKQVYRGKAAPKAAQQVDAQAAQQAGGPEADADPQSRWEALKKGEFAEQFGRDVQAAVQARFKNQADLQGQLDMLAPALEVLRQRAGVESNEDLVNQIMDDDSLYEEAANNAGMTVDSYKDFLKLQKEHEEHVRAAEEQQFQEGVRAHYMKLAQQAEALKAQFPDINLDTELQNPQFLRLTAPDIGMSVEDAYFAVHHKELAPQMMAYGMQRARNQMAQSIMANSNRPREGGLGGRDAAAADMKIDPRNMTRKERDAIRAQIHAGKRITFD